MTNLDPKPYEPEPPSSSAERQLRIAAILLILFGSLSILSNLYFIISAGVQLALGEFHPPADTRPGLREGYTFGFYAPMILGIVAIPLLTLMIVGACAMLTRRRYGLAKTGAILGIIPFTAGCCCVLTLPFGIWSFVLLMRQDVRGLFFR